MLALTVLVACAKDHSFHTEEEENELILRAYNPGNVYPESFYRDEALSGDADIDRYIHIYYENSVSITTDCQKYWTELHTNSQQQASEWSDISNENSSVDRTRTGERKSKKYFEFERVDPRSPSSAFLSRVHRTDYFIPLYNKLLLEYPFQRFTTADTIGIYQGEMLATQAKELTEYLWSCGTIPLPLDKVLTSEITEKGKYYEHHIRSLRVISRGYNGSHDLIRIYDNTFKLSKTTGILTAIRTIEEEIKGRPAKPW